MGQWRDFPLDEARVGNLVRSMQCRCHPVVQVHPRADMHADVLNSGLAVVHPQQLLVQIASSRYATVWEYGAKAVLKVARARSRDAFECLDREKQAYEAAEQLQGRQLPILYGYGCIHTVRPLRANVCSNQAVLILFGHVASVGWSSISIGAVCTASCSARR